MFMAQASIWKVAIFGVCVRQVFWRVRVTLTCVGSRSTCRNATWSSAPGPTTAGCWTCRCGRWTFPRTSPTESGTSWVRQKTHTHTLSYALSAHVPFSFSLPFSYHALLSFFHLTVSLFLLTNFCLTRSSILFSLFLLACLTLSSSLLILSVPLFLLAYYCALSFFFSFSFFTSLLPLFPSLFFFLLPLSTVFSSLYECYSLFSAPLFFRRLLMIDWWVDLYLMSDITWGHCYHLVVEMLRNKTGTFEGLRG